MLFVFCTSCRDEDKRISIDLNEFEPITELYPYHQVTTADDVNYWEPDQYDHDLEPVSVLFSSGTKCSDTFSQSARIATFDALTNNQEGFAHSCLPGYCVKFVRYQDGDNVDVIITKEGMLEFLGDIDTPSDAILWAMVNGYGFNTEKKEAGTIKETNDDYQLLVTKLVSVCVPVQVNRFLLRIKKNGEISILQEKVYSSMREACI